VQRGMIIPDNIVFSGNLNDDNMQQAMHYLLNDAEDNCEIVLSNNLVTPAQLDMLISALSNPHCPSGLHIMLDHCDLSSDHINQFAALFRENKCPRGVLFNFEYNHIGDGAIELLTELLINNEISPGTEFKLQNNFEITENAIKKLAEAFPHNTSVTMLEIDTHDDVRAYTAALVSDDCPIAPLAAPRYQSTFEFCALRNRLLLQYQHDPELRYYIEKLSADACFPLPGHTEYVPSLRFFSLWANIRSGRVLDTGFPEKGFETLRQLADDMQVINNSIGPENDDFWHCNIL